MIVVSAESTATEQVEDNHYFPPSAVTKAFLRPSEHRTTCPWKGEAHYYDVVVGAGYTGGPETVTVTENAVTLQTLSGINTPSVTMGAGVNVFDVTGGGDVNVTGNTNNNNRSSTFPCFWIFNYFTHTHTHTPPIFLLHSTAFSFFGLSSALNHFNLQV